MSFNSPWPFLDSSEFFKGHQVVKSPIKAQKVSKKGNLNDPFPKHAIGGVGSCLLVADVALFVFS